MPSIPGGRLRVFVLRASLAVAALYAAVTLWTLVIGPWKIDVPFRASASSADKPASVTLFFLLVAIVLSRRFHDVIRRGYTETFYLICAGICWVLAWGPFPRLFGAAVLYEAPYGWLLPLPGAGALRAPARLWMMVVLCLVIFMGIVMGRLLAGRTRQTVRLITVFAACGLAADGWATIRAADMPPPLAVGGLQGQTVLFLPAGEVHPDIAAVYRAVSQDFRSINGYSGYEPPYYEALRTLSDDGDARLFDPFVTRGAIHVLVPRDQTRLRDLVERQPGSRLVSDGPTAHYLVPRRDVSPVRTAPRGTRVPIQALASSCSPERVPSITDGTVRSVWMCSGNAPEQIVTVDLGRPSTVGDVVHAMGASATYFPRHLVVETSLDGQSWTMGWEGSPASGALQSAITSPLDARLLIEFPPREARYVRLRQTVRGSDYIWAIAELECWTGS